ncbi:hypothetical protein APH_0148 [Anaplasma phagocytophilum str. HZ]|uniref:Uncharacterized protein n=1 Tax=Anaplasma phagocytophilum (strain HZ) TaxID=212042 RepID=Q2GLH9_ANAPZ|nr:hypothetical protein APH_0148 [Anaplasma phagocytophilum str. HZ]
MPVVSKTTLLNYATHQQLYLYNIATDVVRW